MEWEERNIIPSIMICAMQEGGVYGRKIKEEYGRKAR